MSTTTVSYRSTTTDVEIRALRRREAEARAAARRAEKERRRDDAMRRRIEKAHTDIARQEERFQCAVARLDEAARRLPDLTLRVPQLATMKSGTSQDPAKLEVYAERLADQVEEFSRQLDAAVNEAQRLLDRRIRKAAAWRNAGDLKQQMDIIEQRCREEAGRIQERFTAAAAPDKLSREAELEEVETYVEMLRRRHGEITGYYAGLHARVLSRESAMAIGGGRVDTRGAAEAQTRHDEERQTRAAAALRSHLDARLTEADLCLDELTGALRARVEFALEQAHCRDWTEYLTFWVAREKARRSGIDRALELLQCAPDMVHADPRLSERWTNLAARLQRIAGGLEAFTPDVDREYEQLCADARRLLNTAFTWADWLKAMSLAGFKVIEQEEGQRLLVIDLDHPETWFEGTSLEAEQEGGSGATLDLITDAESLTNEDEVIADICKKLARVAGFAADEVSCESEEIERTHRIKRGRRPRALQQTF